MPTVARPTHSHLHAGGPTGFTHKLYKLYNPLRPKRTLLCQTIAEYLETWFELTSAGQFVGQGDHHMPRSYVR